MAIWAGIRALSLWQVYLAVGALLCAAYVWVPPFAGSGPVFNLLGLSPVVAIVIGVRRHGRASAGPWRWFAIGFLLFWLGDLYTYSYPRLTGAEVPFPSLGDAAYVIVYPALMMGLLILVRRRNPERDRAGAIDSLIITLGLALVSWIALIQPSLHDDELSTRGQAGLDRLPDRRHPAARGGDPARGRLGHAPAGVLPAGREHRGAARHRLRLRPGHPRGRLRRPGVARRRLDQLLPAVGRGGAPPVDARPRARRPGPRRAADAAAARRRSSAPR